MLTTTRRIVRWVSSADKVAARYLEHEQERIRQLTQPQEKSYQSPVPAYRARGVRG